MNEPLITVLMTVYNGGHYLPWAIESVLKQTFTDFEFLIIDDCSQDESLKIIRSYNDKRIRLIPNERNIGQTRSLNKGLFSARGRYIARMDADDWAFPKWLEVNMAQFQAQPQLAVVSARGAVMDHENRIEKILNTPLDYPSMVLRALTASPLNHVGSLYKTDIVQSLLGYDEKYQLAADYDLWSRLIQKGFLLACVPQVLVSIRVHQQSASIRQRKSTDITEMSQIIKNNCHYFTKTRISDAGIDRIWHLVYASQSLNRENFLEAWRDLESIYRGIHPDLNISQLFIEQYISQARDTFYLKKIFDDIEQSHWQSVRVLSHYRQASYGFANPFAYTWLGSWMGPVLLKSVPALYRWSRYLKSQREIGGDFTLEVHKV